MIALAGCVDQLAAVWGFTDDPTKLNVEFAFAPSEVMATMQTTTINANMTAYSTAVGPSSAFRNWTIGIINWLISDPCGWGLSELTE